MKIQLYLFALLLAFGSSSGSMACSLPATYDAIVVMHLDGLDDETLARLAKVVGSEKDVTIEYSCLRSGIIVMQFSNASVGERADIITLARRQLNQAGITQEVEFLHVHVEERGVGKC